MVLSIYYMYMVLSIYYMLIKIENVFYNIFSILIKLNWAFQQYIVENKFIKNTPNLLKLDYFKHCNVY